MSSNSLLIASVIDPGHWYLFDERDACISHQTHSLGGKEFDLFLDTLEKFLAESNMSLMDIGTVYLVTGPASFTGGRIMTLTLGSLAMVYPHLKLVGITLFEYWTLAGNRFPMAIEANREELAIQRTSDSEIELVSKTEAESMDFPTWFAKT